MTDNAFITGATELNLEKVKAMSESSGMKKAMDEFNLMVNDPQPSVLTEALKKQAEHKAIFKEASEKLRKAVGLPDISEDSLTHQFRELGHKLRVLEDSYNYIAQELNQIKALFEESIKNKTIPYIDGEETVLRRVSNALKLLVETCKENERLKEELAEERNHRARVEDQLAFLRLKSESHP